MSKKNRIEQPYGYREQNEFTSEPAMICDAINGISGGGSEDLERKVNELLNKAFVDARYEDERFIFSNSYDADVDSVKFPFIVDTATYDNESKKIIVTFKDDNVEPIEISLEELVSQLNGLVGEEASARTEEDERIWDAIGEISTSGSSIVDLINEEVSARTQGDENLLEALNGEISARTQGDETLDGKISEEALTRAEEDERIWEAIGSGSSIIDLLNEEISARTEADNEIKGSIDEEKEARESADTSIWDAIGEIGASGTNLVEMIEQETLVRAEEDERIWETIGEIGTSSTTIVEIINNEISARTEADNSILDALNAEISARTQGDADLDGKIDTLIAEEASARVNGDNALLEALNAEISARTEGDDVLDDRIDQEAIDRAAADGELDGKIGVEKTEREAADNELDGKIAAEKSARLYWDGQISGAVQTEISERAAEDAAILTALNTETEERKVADDIISGMIETNKVHIEKVETALPVNVKEAYELKDTLGEVLGDRINIYKDSSLKDVELVNEYHGVQGQFLKFTYILEDGSEKEEYVDVSQFLVEAEFKDGLVVTNSGEVKVKIDTASEPYLSVSINGLKISGIDAISNDLALETINRQNGDTNLEALIMNETTSRENADANLTNAIEAEAYERENAISAVNVSIINERTDRDTADRALDALIATERTERQNNFTNLTNQVNTLNSMLSDESSARESMDSMLQNQINSLKNADIAIKNDLSAVTNSLESEIATRQSVDNDLQSQINQKANSTSVYYKNEVDETFARKDEIPSDFYSKADVDAKDAVIAEQVSAEANAREAEDVRLNNLITAETSARISADVAIENRIDSIESEINGKLVEVKANDTSVSVVNSVPTRPEVKVNVSAAEGQIIKLNGDGLYANASLDYDEENNVISFTNTLGTSTFELKTKSEIDNIYYDKPNERIVIEYTVNGTRKEDVYVPVHDLIQEWRTEDGNVGAIALTKDVSIPEVDVLKARLVLNTTHEDNAAVIDDNALYVSKSGITAELNAEIEALKLRVQALEEALQVANQVHTSQSDRISVIEQNDSRQDDVLDELHTYIES